MNKSFWIADIEITVREIIASITIIGFMMLLGFLISYEITKAEIDENDKYNKAVQIDNNTDTFRYAMKTNVGNAFVYGELKAVDPVAYEDINGKYMYLRKVTEKYTSHTRVVHCGKTTTVQTYWTWDEIDEESKRATSINFCGVDFDFNKIEIPNSHKIETIKSTDNNKIRYVYYGVDSNIKGTVFTKLNQGTISDKSKFYENKNIEQALKIATMEYGNTIFWMLWMLLTVTVVVFFYRLDNKWLD